MQLYHVSLFSPPPYRPHSSSDSNAARLLRGCPGNCHPETSLVLTVNTTEGGDKGLFGGSALNCSFYSDSNRCLKPTCDLSSHRQTILALYAFLLCSDRANVCLHMHIAFLTVEKKAAKVKVHFKRNWQKQHHVNTLIRISATAS